jgi:hypothetical protein
MGHHVPRCLEKCHKCWFYEEVSTLMRGDPNNYIPVRERLAASAEQFCTVPPKIRDSKTAYRTGVCDMLEAAKKMLAERE